MKSSSKRRPITRRAQNPDAGASPASRSRRAAAPGELGQIVSQQHRIESLEGTVNHLRMELELLKLKLGTAREERALFVEGFENTPVPYVVHHASGNILTMNGAAQKFFEVKPRTPLSASMVSYFSREGRVRWFEHMRSCVSTRKLVSSEIELRPRPGQPSRVEFLTSPGSEILGGRPSRFYTVLINLSHRRAVEESLIQTREYYLHLVNMLEGIIWEADADDLQVTFVSKFAEQLLGFPLAEWARPGFWEGRIFVEDRERVLDAMRKALAERNELRLDYRVVSADRRVVWLHDSIRVSESGGRSKFQGVAIDVSEQREAEEQLRVAHELLEQHVAERTMELRRTVADMEGFSYSLSHDMRAPIRAMQGYASLVKDMVGDKLGPQPSQFLERIMESAERLDLLVRDVLKYSSTARAPLELKPVPLQPLIDSILHEFPALEAKQTNIQVEQPLPCVLAHEAFVGQALSNLLTNAVKFVPKGKSPRVRVRTEPVHGGASGRVEPWVRIWVEDNGLGIAPEDQGRIFRFFERVYPEDQYEGTGMGLAIVQKAVERLGGRVGVESKPGEGSRFWIELRQA